MEKNTIERKLATRVLLSIRKNKIKEVQRYYRFFVNKNPDDQLLRNINQKYTDFMIKYYSQFIDGE